MQQLKQKMFKYLAVICGTVFLGWQQAGLLASVAALIRGPADGLHETARRVGMAALHTQREVGSTKPIWHVLILLKTWQLGEVMTSLESGTPTIASPG